MTLNDKVKKEVRKAFSDLEAPVRLIVFTQAIECEYCEDTRELVSGLTELSDKLRLEVYDLEADAATAERYGIDKIPAVVVAGEHKDHGIRFYGVPAGYEFTSLIEAIRLVSSGDPQLSDDTKQFLDSLERDAHLQVFVTPTCPYCPSAVVLAHRMALYSDRVKADMVEVTEFPHLGNKYEVRGVPKTVINEAFFQEGAAPEQLLVTRMKEAQL